jgi:hypothetical protein
MELTSAGFAAGAGWDAAGFCGEAEDFNPSAPAHVISNTTAAARVALKYRSQVLTQHLPRRFIIHCLIRAAP